MSAGIDSVLQAAVDAGVVPQVVAMAADADGPIYEGAAGPREVGESDAVEPDTMFRIASMTKMVATTRRCSRSSAATSTSTRRSSSTGPSSPTCRCSSGFDGDTPRLRPPATKATVRQLASHTSGLSYWFWNADIVRWQEVTGTPNVMSGDEVIFTAPLVADPGTQFEYGINTDWLGRVVEAASGQMLDAYFAEHILGPLGMSSTAFLMTPEQRANSAPIHLRGESGAWEASDVDWAQEPDWWAGGHGLHSTPRDYLRFQRMLLGGGTLDGAKLLEPATVERGVHQPDRRARLPARDPDRRPGSARPTSTPAPATSSASGCCSTPTAAGRARPGSGAWAGLFNTHFWVDRATGVTGAIYSQTLPFVEPPRVPDLRRLRARALRVARAGHGPERALRARPEAPPEVPRDLGPRDVLQPHAALRDELAVLARDVTAHSWPVRPWWTGRAPTSRRPSRWARRKSVWLESPTANCPLGSAAAEAPMLQAVSIAAA